MSDARVALASPTRARVRPGLNPEAPRVLRSRSLGLPHQGVPPSADERPFRMHCLASATQVCT
jgi:hypothetical protein